MFQRKLVCYGKTETAAFRRLSARRPEPVEWPEHGLDFLGRNAGSAIGYFDSDLFVIALQAYVDGLSHSVLRRVLQQICQYALEGDGVGEVDAGRILAVKHQLGAFEFQVGRQRFDHLPQVQLHRALALDALRELQELPDQAVHGVQVVSDPGDEFGVRILVEHLDCQPQTRKRSTKIVRDAGDHHGAVFRQLLQVGRHAVEGPREAGDLFRTVFGNLRRGTAACDFLYGIR